MGTRGKTTIYNEQDEPILSFYRQTDSYFDGHGTELQEFLKDVIIVNGYNSGTPKKAANGMKCLAAQLVAHFKNGIGGIYIINHDDEQEYNYDIRYVRPGKVSLIGDNWKEVKVFPLYSEPEVEYDTVAEFVYPRRDGEMVWRKIGVAEHNADYIEGVDLNENKRFKRFRLDRVLDGKIITTPVES